jgi:hypothetical protein
MLIVLPFCNKDADKAINLLRWMQELDGRHVLHSCALVAPKGMPLDKLKAVKEEALLTFSDIRVLQTNRQDERPWPIAPNVMFRCFLKWAAKNHPGYFWWNEPDCIPLKSKWADLIEEQYIKAKKPFLGFIVDKPRPHLTGCAVYPSNAAQYNPALEIGPQNVAWDFIDPDKTLKHAQHTEFFHHQWMGFDGTGVPTFPSIKELEFISPKAVVFHRNKDQTLIDRLRENRQAFETKLELGRRHRLLRNRAQNADTVYAYYEDLNRPEENKIIDLWRKSWEANGWSVMLMGDADTQHYPGHTSFLRSVSTLPSVNPQGYDLACYKRWMAMVTFGGGLMVDYDVMNYGFTPEMTGKIKDENALIFLDGRVPCAVLGEKRLFKFACEYIKNYMVLPNDTEAGKPHVSDMMMFMTMGEVPWIKSHRLVKEYKKEGWESALLVHYCASKTQGNKLDAIKERA